MKAVVAAFNQEKALVGAFSVIVQLHGLIVYNTDQEGASDVSVEVALYCTVLYCIVLTRRGRPMLVWR